MLNTLLYLLLTLLVQLFNQRLFSSIYGIKCSPFVLFFQEVLESEVHPPLSDRCESLSQGMGLPRIPAV